MEGSEIPLLLHRVLQLFPLAGASPARPTKRRKSAFLLVGHGPSDQCFANAGPAFCLPRGKRLLGRAAEQKILIRESRDSSQPRQAGGAVTIAAISVRPSLRAAAAQAATAVSMVSTRMERHQIRVDRQRQLRRITSDGLR
jgi:hypothetical protein